MNIRKMSLILILLPISGCNAFKDVTSPAIVTVVDGSENDFVSIATTSDRRMFMVNERTKRMCGEAPPGVSENITASLTNDASLTGKFPQANMDATVANKLAESAERTVAHVAQKSQGIMLYENLMSGLCTVYLNDEKFNSVDYSKALTSGLDTVIPLITKELELTKGNIAPDKNIIQDKNNTEATDSLAAKAKAATAAAAQSAGVSTSQAIKAGEDASKITSSVVTKQTSPEEDKQSAATAAQITTSKVVKSATGDQSKADEAGKAASNAVLQDSISDETLKKTIDAVNQLKGILKAN